MYPHLPLLHLRHCLCLSMFGERKEKLVVVAAAAATTEVERNCVESENTLNGRLRKCNCSRERLRETALSLARVEILLHDETCALGGEKS